jgi:hypothetical protein
VLLVHDDRAEVLERRKDRRPRSDRDSLPTLLEREPFVVPLAVAQRAVEDRDLVAEDGAEPIDRLRSERDLRHEHDRRLSLLQHHAPQELDVHERFSAAGDTVKQEDVARTAGRERRDCSVLRFRRLMSRGQLRRAICEWVARHHLVVDGDQPARDEALEYGGRELQLRGEVIDGGADRRATRSARTARVVAAPRLKTLSR